VWRIINTCNVPSDPIGRLKEVLEDRA